ncbi:efflux RND transporter periplasmic adaptor subunit [Exilibacterium tricleocarpae]|uniref:Efflux RND transporter periplasmic adaptor subunit n=1 Tax=Exilibacterium tricleocarpae TaxID=2591008 RepID=A0A545TZK9_9GAMM|nr:efflux RND transporter periplasmic adaptor subunit [Exilibacterium tricleocarpae]TQV82654.1 efflux RND transporter periplasmic adaptor subunit [Exilibacterium tricleocarpae]
MRFRPWVVAVLICVAVTAALAGYKVLQIKSAIAFAESFPEPSETVETVTVAQTQWIPEVSVLGEVVAPRSVELRNELAGKIVEVGFAPGARVTRGQLLLQLDISEETAQLKAAEAEMELARLELERFRKLIRQNASSKDRYDRAKAEMAVASANRQALQATIDKKTLRAPFDANAGLHELEAGQFLADNTSITRLVGIDENVWVDFNLPQDRALVPVGTEVTATAPGRSGVKARGRVIARDAAVAADSRNLRMRALLPGVADVLKPGAIVDISVPVGAPQAVGVLPATAIRRDSFGAYVYALVRDEQGQLRARKRAVTLGPERAQNVIVTGALEAGEQIAAKGSYKLREGLLVAVHGEGSEGTDTTVGTGIITDGMADTNKETGNE